MSEVNVQVKVIKHGDQNVNHFKPTSLLAKDEASYKYVGVSRGNKIPYNKLFEEFQNDDLIQITIKKIGVCRF